MSNEVYAITDINGYAFQMREVAAKSLSDGSEQDNLENYINLDQIINLVKENCLGFDANQRPLLNEKTNEKIFEEVSVWIHSVGLAKLAAQNLIECAWDNQSNEMVFWAKETKNNGKSKPKRKRKNM